MFLFLRFKVNKLKLFLACHFWFCYFSHALSGEDTGFNELLNRCQVKKSSNLEANTPVAYGADRRTTSLKRNISTVSAKSDIQQMPSN